MEPQPESLQFLRLRLMVKEGRLLEHCRSHREGQTMQGYLRVALHTPDDAPPTNRPIFEIARDIQRLKRRIRELERPHESGGPGASSAGA